MNMVCISDVKVVGPEAGSGARGARGAFVSVIRLGLKALGPALRAVKISSGTLGRAGPGPGHSLKFDRVWVLDL